MTETMHALIAEHRGGPEQLRFATAPVPRPAPDEVLIAVHAAAITFAELTWDESWTHLPAVPSHEFSGVVVEPAAAGGRFSEGDEVYGLIRFDRQGAAADLVALPDADLALRPTTVSHVAAAALPLAGLTVWQALVDHATLRPGERLLVHGGAGGVGSLAVQLGHELGAEVTTTIRAAGADFVRDAGADHVVDTTQPRFADALDTFDVILDTVGGDLLDRSYALLAAGGRLVTLQEPPDQHRAAEHGGTAMFFVVEPNVSELDELTRLVDAGRLRIPVAAEFPLAQGRAAFESGTATGRRPGKTVLVVSD